MKVLLILPYDTTYRYKTAFLPSISYQPLTLSLLAALIPPEAQAEITLVDEGIQPPHRGSQRYDIVGISIVTSSSIRGYALADHYRAQGSYVLLGGHHASLLPEEAAVHADTVFSGSAEATFPQFFQDYMAGQPKPFYRPVCPNMTGLPMPRRDLMPRRGYLPQPTILADYGCGNRCQYCVIHRFWGGAARRPVEEVIAELKALGKREYLFLDPSPLSNRDYAKELFSQLAKLNIRWAGLATLDAAEDPELMELMRRSGCVGTLLGFETFHQQDLQDFAKTHNRVTAYRRAVERFHEQNISVLGTFMLGLDSDTPAYFRELPDLIRETRIDIPRFAILTPYPATPLFAELEKQGRILTRDWSRYDSIHCVFQPAQMSAEELEGRHAALWRACYTPKQITARLAYAPAHRFTQLVTSIGFHFYAQRLQKLLK